MVAVGVNTAVLEVSSQALYMGRVTGLEFDACIFTNLSRDHIGGHEHPDMEHYKACKLRLFSEHCGGYALINADDPVSREFAEAVRGAGNEVEFFSSRGQTDYCAGEIEYFKSEKGLCSSFYGDFKGKRLKIKQRFPGDFSVMNALSALAVCQYLGADLKLAVRKLEKVSIKGRFETLRFGGVDYVIDYAHNGKSLRSVLEVLRTYEPSRLICLFGSVGCRTQMRRPELGRVAAELADFSILTADNPDIEPVERIIADIAAEYTDPESYISIPDRKRAIEYAVEIARPGDIVLLAGKGHEDYQLIDGRHIPFSEREILMNAAAALV
jgi:UDP-N-acetylmuramoyl-L-alanyl-D-glutamate--2,6-diaminopimelate ligase